MTKTQTTTTAYPTETEIAWAIKIARRDATGQGVKPAELRKATATLARIQTFARGER